MTDKEMITENTMVWGTVLQMQKDLGKLEGQVESLQLQVTQLAARPQVSIEQPNVSTAGDPAAELQDFPCPKLTLSKLISGKLQMELWLTLGDGNLSKWPQITYVGDLEKVESFLPDTYAWDFNDLPFEYDVAWTVAWKQGRLTGKQDDDGNPTRYKDLVSITERTE